MEKYWYCGVAVKGIATVYSYISDMGEIQPGTYVLVPFGNFNKIKAGIVKSCGKYTAEEAPYPVEKTKHILRKATIEEYKEDLPIGSYCEGDFENAVDEADYFIATEDWGNAYLWAEDFEDSSDRKIIEKVVECYKLCADNGLALAAINLADMYYYGKNVGLDYGKAFEFYKIAADSGNVWAICRCGNFFYYGLHQERDYEQAYKYFSLGVLLHDDERCLYKLGDMYLDGKGVEKNEKFSLMLYKKAMNISGSENGNANCLGDTRMRVGKCYLYGLGTNKDVEKANELLSLAVVDFYKRRKEDNFIIQSINTAKKMLAEAQSILDKETSDYQRKRDIPFEGGM